LDAVKERSAPARILNQQRPAVELVQPIAAALSKIVDEIADLYRSRDGRLVFEV
jgi:hypothetical protein